jgi:hypothetical protein
VSATATEAGGPGSLGQTLSGGRRVAGRGSTANLVHVLMALLLVLTAIVSFAPTSYALLSRVLAGGQAIPPPVVHFHAIAMTSWLLVLLTQSLLAYTHRKTLHRKLGLASLVLAPCILVSMVGMDLWGIETFNVQTTVVATAVALPEQAAQLREYTARILLIHGASYLLFPAFLLWGLRVRRTDNESHKRLMILATLVLMIPGIGRLLSVTKLVPDFGLSLIDARHLYLLILIAPALLYETVTRGLPHRTYRLGVGLLAGWMIIAHLLWRAPWWIEHGPRLLGVS